MAIVLFLTLATTANAETREPAMEPYASWIAQQEIEVYCYAQYELDQEDNGDWGFTWLNDPTIHMGWRACVGVRDLLAKNYNNPLDSAIGVLVLLHESYHQRVSRGLKARKNEATTECWAIRHHRYMSLRMGASPEYAQVLLVYGLLWHWWLTTVAPQYHLPSCKEPNPW